ncbi:uncharacterized protein DS421_7g209870 [Arachis hypogaea]|nr:uncharacterized protein DS421_7g209870 [Arachis hypogaea]
MKTRLLFFPINKDVWSPIASQPVGAQLPTVRPVGKQNQHALGWENQWGTSPELVPYLEIITGEGRSLPGVLPSNILLALLPSGLPATQYSFVTWGNPSGFQQEEGMSDPGAQRVNPTTGRPPRPASIFLSDEGLQKQQKFQVPVLENHIINQLSLDEQNSINLKFQEASEADTK